MKAVLIMLLAIVALGSAYAATYTQHEHRRYFAQWQELIQTRDELNTEWGRLQLERGVLTSHSIVEQKAVDVMRMRMPEIKDVVFVAQTEPGG